MYNYWELFFDFNLGQLLRPGHKYFNCKCFAEISQFIKKIRSSEIYCKKRQMFRSIGKYNLTANENKQ